MESKSKSAAVILAAGSSERFGGSVPKQFAELGGKPLFIHSIKTFEMAEEIEEIVVVVHGERIDLVSKLIKGHGFDKVNRIIAGGRTRQESSKLGLDSLSADVGYVLIHDAARPMVGLALIGKLIEEVKAHGAVIPVTHSTDTILELDERGYIYDIPDSASIVQCQTPQAFETRIIKEAHKFDAQKGTEDSRDDSSLVLEIGSPVYTVPADPYNIKITHPLDIKIAELILTVQGD